VALETKAEMVVHHPFQKDLMAVREVLLILAAEAVVELLRLVAMHLYPTAVLVEMDLQMIL
jgi:hypothetical protein